MSVIALVMLSGTVASDTRHDLLNNGVDFNQLTCSASAGKGAFVSVRAVTCEVTGCAQRAHSVRCSLCAGICDRRKKVGGEGRGRR